MREVMTADDGQHHGSAEVLQHQGDSRHRTDLSSPTPAMADTVNGTTIMPMPIPPMVIGRTRFGKYGMPASRVEP